MNGYEGHAPDSRRDNHYRLEGPIVAEMQAVFIDNWLKTSGDILHDEDNFPKLNPVGSHTAGLLSSSPDERATNVFLLLLMLISAARDSIRIEQAYFVPDRLIVNALVHAAQRGVEVEIILPGALIDHAYVRSSSRYRWGPLLEAGVKIFEFQPSMLHVKLVLIDDCCVLTGSANLDYRSLFRCDEILLLTTDHAIAAEHCQTFLCDKQHSIQISQEQWRNRPFSEKATDMMADLCHSQF